MSNDTMTAKIPPQNIEAEQMVLGAILLEGEALNQIADVIDAEDFYKSGHKAIYDAMLRLYEQRQNIDLVTLHDALRGNNALEAAGGASYLAQLVSLVPTSANIKSHARIVREKSILRRIEQTSHQNIARCHEEPAKQTADEQLDRACQAMYDIASKKGGIGLVPLRSAAGAAFSQIEKRYENRGKLLGIPTGFLDLDAKLCGLQDGDLVVIAGRPSMGKTAFAMNIASHAAIHHGKKCAVFSLEMSREQLIIRMMGSEARIDAGRLRSGNIADADWVPLSRAAGMLTESGISIDDTPALSAMEIRARARRAKAERGLDMIIIDYLQLMRGTGSESNREQEISGISRALKALAKDLSIPVVALSQLNRAVETRAGNSKRPTLSDLRESGAIEQDADVILFLYREEVYNKCICPEDRDCVCERRGAAECIIGKQRNGPIGIVNLAFVAKHTRFENAASREYV